MGARIMSTKGTYDAVVSANKIYASDFGDKGKLALPPARHFAILTCMDARPPTTRFARW
jgi:carbonic anhydrase